MFIRNLKIINTKKDTIIQDITFHAGTNFIVDLEDSIKHNKVGKTTFLKLLDIGLGAKDRSYLYMDPESNSTAQTLKNLINNDKFAIELEIGNEIKSPTEIHVLYVELFQRGKYKINGISFNQKDYREELNVIFFHNNIQTPTFRQLINSFVRISMAGDNNTFLRCLPRSSNIVYRGVYNYLFNISDPSIDKEREDLNRAYNSVKNGEAQYKRVQGVNNSEALEQIISVLKNERDTLRVQLNDIVSSDEFVNNREVLMETRKKYLDFSIELSNAEYYQEKNRLALANITDDSKYKINEQLSRKFFDEIKEKLPELNKTFEELVEFNDRLRQNKVDYLKEVQSTLDSKVKTLREKRNSLVEGNETLVSLIANNKIDEYNHLFEQLSQREKEINEREQMLQTIKNFSEDIKEIQDSINELNNENENFSSGMQKMEIFNASFTRIASLINGERPVLTYNSDLKEFPLNITELDGTSTGTRKSLIASYDLAYQEFARKERKRVPRFIVHDVIETIEGANLRKLVDLSNSLNTQYIVAVLKEKLDSSGFTENEQKDLRIIQLSMKKRLFEKSE